MRTLIFIFSFFYFFTEASFGQSVEKNSLLGKWTTCKIIDSTDFGNIGVENLDSFKTSVEIIAQKKGIVFKGVSLDSILNINDRAKYISNLLKPLFIIYSGTWILFRDDSTVTEHINEYGSKEGKNLKRTYEYNPLTNLIILNKLSNPETVRIKILSDDTMLFTFISEGLTLLIKKTQ